MKALVIDKVHDILFDVLAEAGIEFYYLPKITKEAFDKLIPDYEILIVRSKFKILKEDIDRAQSLKIIGRVGAGLENIDIEYAKSKNITCINTPEGNRDAVGEHAVGMLLNLLNKIPKAHKEIQNGIWDREANWGTELSDKVVGIIGYGNMGGAFGKRISAFAKEVIAYDKYKDYFSDNYVREADMKDLFERCDVLSLHVPLTSETKHLVNAEFLKKFKKDIYIINTARGECVKTSDLVAALEQGKVKGACLDVLEYEKTTFESLFAGEMPEPLQYVLKSPKVILTPHVAGWTDEAYYKLSRIMAEKIVDLTKE
jgi:D-3-phosphoglycerate dehydrogenase